MPVYGSLRSLMPTFGSRRTREDDAARSSMIDAKIASLKLEGRDADAVALRDSDVKASLAQSARDAAKATAKADLYEKRSARRDKKTARLENKTAAIKFRGEKRALRREVVLAKKRQKRDKILRRKP